jgi:putative ABC transport system permease protein
MRLGRLRQDLTFAIRMLRKNKTFSAIAILTLALGIGANSAIFSIVNGVLLRPLPYKDSNRLALLRLDLGADKGVCSFSFAELKDFQTQASLIEEVTAFNTFPGLILMIGDRAEPATLGIAWANFFSMLGIKPLMGREFRPDENLGQAPVMILSYEFWQSKFAGDPAILGKSFQLGGGMTQVVGVMPPRFQLPQFKTFREGSSAQPTADFWTPIQFRNDRGLHFLRLIARIKPGVSFAQAQAEMDSITARLSPQFAEYRPDGIKVALDPLQRDIVRSARPAIIVLASAVGFVLLIACSNVASLLIARSKTREREIAVRSAIGASGLDLVRQVLVESAVLSTIAGCAGIGLAYEGVHILKLLKPVNVPRLDEVQMDFTVLAVSAAVSIVIGLLFGMLPAWQASRLNVAEVLRGGRGASRGASSNPLMRALVIGEVGLCLVLLICSGLMIRTFAQLQRVDPGFDAAQTLTFQALLNFQPGQTQQFRLQYFEQLRDRIRALPGVQSVGATSILPFDSTILTGPYAFNSQTLARWGALTGDYRVVLPGYFETMRTQLRSGRFFTEHDGAAADQVIVDESLARAAWPGRNPIGQTMWFMDSFAGTNPAAAEVIGVVQHVRDDRLNSEGRPQIYLPAALATRRSLGLTPLFAVRVAGDPMLLAPAIRQAALDLSRNSPVTRFETLESRLSRAMAGTRFELTLMSVFAGIAVVLALVGLYGVISYTVSERWREMGIRIALGAQPSDVRRLVLGQGLRLTSAGVVAGLAVAFAVTPLLRSMLYGVSSTDPATFCAVSLLLLLISAMACYVPARRATKADPIEAMRSE